MIFFIYLLSNCTWILFIIVIFGSIKLLNYFDEITLMIKKLILQIIE